MKKQYKLLQWYPSLPTVFTTNDVYSYNSETNSMKNKSLNHVVFLKHDELHESFWELIEEKKPLFITEDEVEYVGGRIIIVVKDTFEKRYASAGVSHQYDKWLYFAHEYNADEYIWRNKRLFSYEDIVMHIFNEECFEQIAKERSKL